MYVMLCENQLLYYTVMSQAEKKWRNSEWKHPLSLDNKLTVHRPKERDRASVQETGDYETDPFLRMILNAGETRGPAKQLHD